MLTQWYQPKYMASEQRSPAVNIFVQRLCRKRYSRTTDLFATAQEQYATRYVFVYPQANTFYLPAAH
jgi:hypothetical protein